MTLYACSSHFTLRNTSLPGRTGPPHKLDIAMTLQALSSSTLSFLFSVSFCFFYLFVDLAECRHIVTLRSLPEGNLYEAARTHAHPRGRMPRKASAPAAQQIAIR